MHNRPITNKVVEGAENGQYVYSINDIFNETNVLDSDIRYVFPVCSSEFFFITMNKIELTIDTNIF